MIRTLHTYWVHIAAGGAILVALVLLVLLLNTGTQSGKSLNQNDEDTWGFESGLEEVEIGPEEIAEHSQNEIVVDVKGAVQMPGVYTLDSGSRIDDAIRAAGGLKENADSNQINFAMLLQDEMLIYAPEQGEEAEYHPMTTFQSGSHAQSVQTAAININTATEEELTSLSGIGPSKAASIVLYREENGLFQTIEDLTNVSGIGEKSFEKLKEEITVR